MTEEQQNTEIEIQTIKAANVDAALKACAEMREFIEELGHGNIMECDDCESTSTRFQSVPIAETFEALLRLDCGKDYVHKDVVLPLKEALVRLMPYASAYASHYLRNPKDHLDEVLKQADDAIARAKELGV